MEIVTSSSSEWKEELKTPAVFAVLDEQNKKSTRSCWVHDIYKKRSTLEELYRLVQEL
jgi:predicted solute-binding protein